MLGPFDWLRRSRTGAELLAALRCLEEQPELFAPGASLGPPLSALAAPCGRCWIYSRQAGSPYCRTCAALEQRRRKVAPLSRSSLAVWGLARPLPANLRHRALGVYVHDEQHFLLAMQRTELKPWLQELVLRHGPELRGLLQFFPMVGLRSDIGMGDLLCRVVHREAHFPVERMRVCFYAEPVHVISPRQREREGVLTFAIADFLGWLEMAEVFRTVLRPAQQQELFALLHLENAREASFHWGRFLGQLEPRGRDMLATWRMRAWTPGRVQLLGELTEYVALPVVS